MSDKENGTATGCPDSFGGAPDGVAVWPERELTLCAKLLELAQEKRRILLAGPAGGETAAILERIIIQEEAVVARWRELERDETARPEEYGEIISRLPDGCERIQRLGRMVQELWELNRENLAILKRFQRYVDFTVSLLEKRAGSGTYGETEVKLGKGRKAALKLSRISRQV